MSLARFPAYLYGYGEQIYADPRFLSAQSAYSACMKASEYEVAGTGAAINLAKRLFSSSGRAARQRGQPTRRASVVSVAEREMATTDATCQKKSGVFLAWDQVGFSFATPWITKQMGEILPLVQLRQASITRAREILAQGDSPK